MGGQLAEFFSDGFGGRGVRDAGDEAGGQRFRRGDVWGLRCGFGG